MKFKFITIFLSILFIPTYMISQSNHLLPDIEKIIDTNYKSYYEFYKDLHQNPELSLYEQETSKKIATKLKEIGYNVTDNFGGYGVVGILKNGKGPTLLIRTDMDALPIEEKTNLDYASTKITKDNEGVKTPIMHACGHDMHMTVFIGTATTLFEMQKHWKGTLILIAQPAEEVSKGAKAMLKAGLFEKFPIPDYCLALHVNPNIESGKVGLNSGPFFASVDMLDITVFGLGGHGAIPDKTVDPIVLAARMVLAFQTIVSREVAPLETAVVTVGSINGGTKHNIIPDKVKMQLTIRTYSNDLRNKIIESLKRISKGIAISAGLEEDKYPIVFVRDENAPPVLNDVELTKKVKTAFEKILGEDNIIEVQPTMAGEDFSIYGNTKEKVPICMFWLGAVSEKKIAEYEKNNKMLPSLHSPYFSPDVEKTMKTGIKAMSGAAMSIFSN
ncbi:MAG: amidohydrolase [Bacteroidales bacterium]|nr:amidohydrolase [Bacteroidales bacterium]MBN2755884.1 amidohydrolase [Bacteroidales bacterium]